MAYQNREAVASAAQFANENQETVAWGCQVAADNPEMAQVFFSLLFFRSFSLLTLFFPSMLETLLEITLIPSVLLLVLSLIIPMASPPLPPSPLTTLPLSLLLLLLLPHILPLLLPKANQNNQLFILHMVVVGEGMRCLSGDNHKGDILLHQHRAILVLQMGVFVMVGKLILLLQLLNLRCLGL